MFPTDQITVFLGLGTNLGNRRANLRRAVTALEQILTVQAISPVYRTAPWGQPDQPYFFNLCLKVATSLAPLSLLAQLKTIETDLGRRPSHRWGPRLIDLDILFYNGLILQSDTLIIPHARLAERAFVLAPLADLAPGLVHPQTGLSVGQMLAEVDATGVQKLAQPLFKVEA